MSFLLLAGSLVLVIYGANILVDGASSLAKMFNIPNIVIGLTVVAFGTSSPELAITSYSAYTGNTDIAIGNVVGSNICNILLIIGVTSIVYPLTILKNTVLKEIPLSLLAAIVLYVMINDIKFSGGSVDSISIGDGIILLGYMAIFVYYLVHLANTSGEDEDIVILNLSKSKSILYILGGFALLIGGGKIFVDSAVELALRFGMSQAVVGLTIVSLGTSLPELVTSVVAALKKNSDIAVGNVVGSNIFNIFLVLGVGSIISSIPKGNITNIDFYVCILASLALLASAFVMRKHTVTKVEGIFFVIMYIVYLSYQVHLVH
ncbi:MAG: calcium/sodium antiporter [Saprospiraceae bacterium]|nr:calcium/sodium antiporter [Saprospiraceae bacterium]